MFEDSMYTVHVDTEWQSFLMVYTLLYVSISSVF